MATKSKSLLETTWKTTHENQICVPSDIVLETNNVDEALVNPMKGGGVLKTWIAKRAILTPF